MNRREFLKRSLEGIVLGSIPFISCTKNPVDSEPYLKKPVNDNRREHKLIFNLKLDKFEYKPKEPINLEYSTRNNNDTAVTFCFPNQQQFNYFVYEGNELIYYDVKFVLPALSSLTINPHQTIIFKRTWDQKNDSREYVWPGNYTLIAGLMPSRIKGLTVDRIYSKVSLDFKIIGGNSNSIIKDNIEYCMQTDKKDYKLGENVEMLYMVTNLKDEDVTFRFPHSPQYNFWIEKDGKVIWRAINGWWTVETEFTLSPNNSKKFNYIWDMRDNKNILVNVGKYSAIGGLYAGTGNYVNTKVSVPIEIIP